MNGCKACQRRVRAGVGETPLMRQTDTTLNIKSQDRLIPFKGRDLSLLSGWLRRLYRVAAQLRARCFNRNLPEGHSGFTSRTKGYP